jgi:hypothetical protein
MFRLITSAAIFFALGSLAACLVTILLGIVGVPGGLLAKARKGASAPARRAGMLLAVLCQSYVALAFAAAVAESARSIVGDATGVGAWAFWTSAFLVAGAPAAIAVMSIASHLKESPENYNPTKLIALRATRHTSKVSVAGFILFALFPPSIEWAWGWVPHF